MQFSESEGSVVLLEDENSDINELRQLWKSFYDQKIPTSITLGRLDKSYWILDPNDQEELLMDAVVSVLFTPNLKEMKPPIDVSVKSHLKERSIFSILKRSGNVNRSDLLRVIELALAAKR